MAPTAGQQQAEQFVTGVIGVSADPVGLLRGGHPWRAALSC